MAAVIAVPYGIAEFVFRPVEIIGVVFLRIHAFPSACPNSAEPWTLISNGGAGKVGGLLLKLQPPARVVYVFSLKIIS